MSNPTVVMRVIRDGFDDDFLLAYARMVIAFGRLEGEVKRAIKSLAVSLKVSVDFTGGIAEAERRHVFSAMCDHMLDLYRQKHAACEEGDQLAVWVRQTNGFAEARNRIVHGTLTIDDDGTPLVMHTRLDRKTQAVEFTDLSISTSPLEVMHQKVTALWHGLHEVRQTWTEQ